MTEDVLGRTYKSILIAWAIAMVLCLMFRKPLTAVSVACGTALGAGLLGSLHWFVRAGFLGGTRRPGRALLRMGLVKYPLLATVLYVLLRWDNLNVGALVLGVSLVYIAIVAGTVGEMMVKDQAWEKNGQSPGQAKRNRTWKR
jgi:hypothetical protein